MADEETTPPVDPQAGDTETLNPQAGESTSQTDPQVGESQTDTALSLEEAKKLRSEARNLRNRLKEAENLKNELAELKKFKEDTETAKLSETEKQTATRLKLEKQLAEAQAALTRKETEVQEQKINNSIFDKAAKVGINPGLAAKVLDHADIDYDEKGNPTNIEDLLKEALKEYPEIAVQKVQQQQRQASQSTAGGATNPPRSQTGIPTTLNWDYVNKIMQSPNDYNSLPRDQQKELGRWIAANRNKH